MAPLTSEKSRMGANCMVPMRPSRSGESVSCSTSHDWATVCIQPETSATIWARKNRR
jgi:hypothetical protein